MWYTITKVEEKKRWSNKFGDFITYDIGLMGEDGVPCPSCMLNQKDSTPAPLVDGRLHGWIEDTDFGQKFNKTQPEDGGGSSAPAKSHTGASQPATGSNTNDTQNQIIRQSSLKVAADLCIANKKDKDIEVQTVLMLAEMLAQYAQTGKIGQAGGGNAEIDAHMAEQVFFDQEVK